MSLYVLDTDTLSLLQHGHSQFREVDRDKDGLGGICDYCHVGAPSGASRSTMSVRTSRMMVGVAPMVAATAVATSSGRAVPASVRSMSATSPSGPWLIRVQNARTSTRLSAFQFVSLTRIIHLKHSVLTFPMGSCLKRG